jgi:hypothetical protein
MNHPASMDGTIVRTLPASGGRECRFIRLSRLGRHYFGDKCLAILALDRFGFLPEQEIDPFSVLNDRRWQRIPFGVTSVRFYHSHVYSLLWQFPSKYVLGFVCESEGSGQQVLAIG